MVAMKVSCSECHSESGNWSPREWRCSCGGPLEFSSEPPFDAALIDAHQPGLWRYRNLLPFAVDAASMVSMGEGWTPLVEGVFDGRPVLWKLEFLNPTGSYKDRGIGPLTAALREHDVRCVVEDSSGNAGASVAAYSARAGLRAKIFVPAHASPVKQSQIALYGAQVVPVPGPRIEATRAAEAALLDGTAYASHVWQPPVLAGLQTVAWEIWEQMGGQAPDWLVCPVGQGTLLLGAYRGFRALLDAGLSERIPRLVAVQSTNCDPLQKAWIQRLDTVPLVSSEPTVAEGIRIAHPVRGWQLLQAIRRSNGVVLAVEENQIVAAQTTLARLGLYVEPTSAVAVAALPILHPSIHPEETVAVLLTGSGLKGSPVD